MAYIERMDGQNFIDSYRAYLDYVEEHLEFVRQAFCVVTEACSGKMHWASTVDWYMFRAMIMEHDLSKFSAEEFTQYANYFYPPDGTKKDEHAFQTAWEHHKANNSHHHEVAHNYGDVLHMVIDWTAMGYKFGDSAQEYYEANQDKINLSDEHKEFMYEIFGHIEEHRKSVGAEV